jgi:asparagine synthetase B (glutamine-hydrolysing)
MWEVFEGEIEFGKGFGRGKKRWDTQKLLRDVQELEPNRIYHISIKDFKETYGVDLTDIKTEKELKKQIRRVLRRISEKIPMKFSVKDMVYIKVLETSETE